jgi:hypothetical protein
VYWSGWTVDWKLFSAIGIGLLIMALAQRTMPADERVPRLNFRAASWLCPYIGGMSAISYLGQYDGRGTIPFWWDLGVVADFSVAIYALAMAVRLEPEQTR